MPTNHDNAKPYRALGAKGLFRINLSSKLERLLSKVIKFDELAPERSQGSALGS